MTDNDSNDYVPVFPISPAAKKAGKSSGSGEAEKPEQPGKSVKPDQKGKTEEKSAGKPAEAPVKKPRKRPARKAPAAAEAGDKAKPAEAEKPKKPARKRPPRKKAAPAETPQERDSGKQPEEKQTAPDTKAETPTAPSSATRPRLSDSSDSSGTTESSVQATPASSPSAAKTVSHHGSETMDTMPESTEEIREVTLEELPQDMQEAVARAGWQQLSPVQSKAVGPVMDGRDVMVQARTGSGKTGAFVLPILHRIDPERKECQALVMLPTRELARQVAAEAEMLAGDTGVKVCAVYGGVGFKPQEDALRGGAQLVVGTPGRVLDHLLRRTFNLDGINTLVFDEADRMLSIGFYPDMLEVKRYLPRRPVNSLMFSATYPPHVMRLSDEFLRDPLMISLSGDSVHVAEVEHVFYEVPGMGRDRSLIRIIESENPSSAIIFCNTKSNVHYLAEVLKQFGYDADPLSADLSQSQREKVLGRVRSGNLRFLVATDVAARGIDIPELSHVFQYETPEDPESYIHRAGRTGRAGASGTAITLVDVMQKMELRRIGTRYKIPFEERTLPAEEDIQRIVGDRLTALLDTRHRKLKPLQKERLLRFVPLVKEMGEDEKGALLVAMLLDEHYQTSLHAAPPQPEAPAPVPPAENGKPRGRGGRSRKSGRDNRPSRPSGGDSRRSEGGSSRPRREEPRQAQQPKPARRNQPAQKAAPDAGGDPSAPTRKRRPRRRKKKPSTSES